MPSSRDNSRSKRRKESSSRSTTTRDDSPSDIPRFADFDHVNHPPSNNNPYYDGYDSTAAQDYKWAKQDAALTMKGGGTSSATPSPERIRESTMHTQHQQQPQSQSQAPPPQIHRPSAGLIRSASRSRSRETNNHSTSLLCIQDKL